MRRPAREGENPIAAWCYRQAGDKYLLVEYGPAGAGPGTALPRARADAGGASEPGCPASLDLTPGIRSLQVHFDPRRCRQDRCWRCSSAEGRNCPRIDDMEVPSRIVHLPLSWDDPATRLAIEKYMQSVRKDAPWCPSNIEFIRRINGLDSIEDGEAHRVRRQLPGDGPGRRLPRRAGGHAARPAPPAGHHQVQPGAHLDAGERRRHRRRLHVRVRHGRPRRLPVRRPHRADVEPLSASSRRISRKPWLLRFFDQIRFYPVSEAELLQMREDFPPAASSCALRKRRFRLRDYRAFLADNADAIAAFKATSRPPSKPSASAGVLQRRRRPSRPARIAGDRGGMTPCGRERTWPCSVALANAPVSWTKPLANDLWKHVRLTLPPMRRLTPLQLAGEITPACRDDSHHVWIHRLPDDAIRGLRERPRQARIRPAAPLRHSLRHQGQHRPGRRAHHRRLPEYAYTPQKAPLSCNA
jgi:allophanate hydrolase subunit 1